MDQDHLISVIERWNRIKFDPERENLFVIPVSLLVHVFKLAKLYGARLHIVTTKRSKVCYVRWYYARPEPATATND